VVVYEEDNCKLVDVELLDLLWLHSFCHWKTKFKK